MRRLLARAAACLLACAVLVSGAAAEGARAESRGPGLVLVYDGSSSMWAQMAAFGPVLDPRARRYAVAADFSQALVGRIAAAAPGYAASLFLFGTERPRDCSDRGPAIGFGPLSDPRHVERLKARIATVTPTGITPIAASIQDAAKLLDGYAPAVVVIVTDGEEECAEAPAAPCEAAADAKRANPALIAHVIGVALPKAVLARMACVAERTGGTALAISEPRDVEQALSALTAAIRPAPAPRGTITARATVERAQTFPDAEQSPRVRLLDGRTGEPVAASDSGSLSERVPVGPYVVEFSLGEVVRTSRIEPAQTAGDATVAMAFPTGILTAALARPGGRAFEGEPDVVWRIERVATADGRAVPAGTNVVSYRAPGLRIAVPPGAYRIEAAYGGRLRGGDLPPLPVASGREAVRSIELN